MFMFMFMLQYYIEYSNKFRSTNDHHQGTKPSNAAQNQIIQFFYTADIV